MNDKLMLDENEALARLRAGRHGAEPPLQDVTGAAMRAGHKLRTRRRAMQAGSGIVAAGLSVVAILAAAPVLDGGERSVVVPPAGSAQDAPGRSTGDPRAEARNIADLNREYVAAALGPSFVAGGGRIVARAGSPAAQALPVGYTGAANVRVGYEDVSEACSPDASALPAKDCDRRTVGKRTVLLRTYPGDATGSGVGPGVNSVPVSSTDAYFVRANGETVIVTLLAHQDTTDPRLADAPSGPAGAQDPDVARDAAVAWLLTYGDALATAATDPRIRAADPAAEQPRSNQAILLEALGNSFEADGDDVVLDPGGQAAAPLRDGTTATAFLRFLGGQSEIDDLCGSTCVQESLSGDRRVWTATSADYVASERAVLGRALVLYVQPDGETVHVQLLVRGPEIGLEAVEVQRETLLTWLESFRDALIAAATDPRATAGAGA